MIILYGCFVNITFLLLYSLQLGRTVFSDSLTADSGHKPIRRLPVTKVNADSEDMHILARLDLQFFPEFIAGHGNIAGRHFRLRIFRAESLYRLFVKRNDIYNIEHLAEELADVVNVTEQIIQMFGLETDFKVARHAGIQKTLKRSREEEQTSETRDEPARRNL